MNLTDLSFVKQHSDKEYDVFVDNHMLSAFSVCPRKFFYQQVQNIRHKGGIPFYPSYGIWFHDVLQLLYSHLEDGISSDDLVKEAAVLWLEQDMPRFAESEKLRFDRMVGVWGFMAVGNGQCPVSALSMVLSYYKNYYELDRAQWKVIATEAGFGFHKEVPLGHATIQGQHFNFYYTGRPDLVVRDRQGRIFPVDHKTTDRIDKGIDSKYKPHSETAGYIFSIQEILGSPVDRCIINVCAREVPTPNPRNGSPPAPRFKRLYPTYSPSELEEWKENALSKAVAIIQNCFEEGPWGMRETQCHFPTCEYVEIDSVKPESRSIVIDANYVVSTPWKPYQEA